VIRGLGGRSISKDEPSPLWKGGGLVDATGRWLVGAHDENPHPLYLPGTSGLLRAVDLFDPARGVTFVTHATWWVRQTMGRAIEKQGRLIRLPAVVDEELKMLRRKRELASSLGRPPCVADLVEATRLPRANVEQLLELDPTQLRLDAGARRSSASDEVTRSRRGATPTRSTRRCYAGSMNW
jgi:DNA-directed RNA polymerase sigma subunit (sigma70/sigma32)